MESWFEESRFGMFIHWGLYAVAGGRWKGMETPWVSEWLMRKFTIPATEYATLANDFHASGFNADEWAKAAADAGMKYMVITSKHHDGFAMFHSKYDRYNIVDATPFGRDPLAELAEACRRHGLKLGFYYSQNQDWNEPGAAGNTWDFTPEQKTPEAFQAYLDGKVKFQLRELLTNYGDVAIIWFDTPGAMLPEQSEDLKNYVHSLQPHCLVSGRVGNGKGDYDSLGDNAAPAAFPERPAEGLGTMNMSWGYKPFDTMYKSIDDILLTLAHMAGNSTNYLLNVGPDGDGRFPPQALEILKGTGEFLKRYPDVLYGTSGIRRMRPFLFPWGDITVKGNRAFVWLIRRYPGPMTVYGFRNNILSATADNAPVPFTQTHVAEKDFHKLELDLPESLQTPTVITLQLDGPADFNRWAYSACEPLNE